MKWKKVSSSSSSSSTSSSFSISSVFQFSWIAKLKLLNSKSNYEIKHANSSTPPPPPLSPPQPYPAYVHPSFSSNAIDILGYLDRSPPSVHGGEASRRLSLDEDYMHRPRRINTMNGRQHVQHYCVGNDLEMLTLGQHIPFSTLARPYSTWPFETESHANHSTESGPRQGRRCRQPRPQRCSKLTISSTETAEPRRSFKCKTKVRICSPRSAAARAAVGKRKTTAARNRSELERFAVAKCSSDPQKDFRESMVEMIRQKGIRRSEDLESLLACYLMLNSDEHHDVIVKVFRQVWFEMKSQQLASKFN